MKLVIVGGVAAGMSCAAKIKRNLKEAVDVTVFEMTNEISYGACGIPFYVSDHIKEAEELIAKTPEDFQKSGIDVKILHQVLSVDADKKTVEVKDLQTGAVFVQAYDKLVVAAGAAPKKFPPMHENIENLFTVRNVADATKIKELVQSNKVTDVVVVGAGFIGLEMAEACTHYGIKASIVELGERILSVMDPEVTDLLTEELKNNNVDVYTSAKLVEIIRQDEKIVAVKIETAQGYKEVACQLVINSAGIAPMTDWIDCVEKASNGAIIVDEKMSTSNKDIYAAGDCSIMKSFITNELQYAPLGSNANKQGRIIADVLSGIEPKNFKLIGSSAIKLYGLDAAKVGLSELEAKRLNLDFKTTMIQGNSYASYYGTEKVSVKIVYDAKTRKILGAQTVGQGIVVPRANYFAIAITAGLTVDEMGFLDLCYSPPFSGVWDVTLIASNTAK